MEKKKTIIISLLCGILMIGIILSIVVLNKALHESDLQTGFYFIEARGTVNICDDETISLPMLVYFYNGTENSDSEVLNAYSDFHLLTEDGARIEISITNEIIDSLTYKDDKRIKQMDVPVVLRNSMFNGENSVITSFCYNDGNDQVVVDIGKIRVNKTTTNTDKVEFYGEKYDWRSFVQPVFRQYEIIVNNSLPETVKAKSLYLDEDYLQVTSKDIDIPSGEGLEVIFSVTEECSESCCVYYLRPLLEFEADDNSYCIIQSNIERRSFIGYENYLYNYFLNKNYK